MEFPFEGWIVMYQHNLRLCVNDPRECFPTLDDSTKIDCDHPFYEILSKGMKPNTLKHVKIDVGTAEKNNFALMVDVEPYEFTLNGKSVPCKDSVTKGENEYVGFLLPDEIDGLKTRLYNAVDFDICYNAQSDCTPFGEMICDLTNGLKLTATVDIVLPKLYFNIKRVGKDIYLGPAVTGRM